MSESYVLYKVTCPNCGLVTPEILSESPEEAVLDASGIHLLDNPGCPNQALSCAQVTEL